MKLFEVFPERFFQIFAGTNKKIYAEAAFLLFEQYQTYRIGIQYEVMQDLFQELIETKQEFGEGFVDEDLAESNVGIDKAREIANYLLRRFIELEWIEIETRDQFQDFIILPIYTSKLLSTFKELCDGKTVEYQRYSFLTYQLLTGPEAKNRPGFTLIEAEKISLQFLEELRALLNNMKHHIETVVKKNNIEEILNYHFNEYKSKVIDKSYHRLKTSDHVSKYRQKIIQIIQDCILDDNFIEEAVTDLVNGNLIDNISEAKNSILNSLYNIQSIYDDFDELLYQIDLRHHQYLRAIYYRARYLVNYNSGIEQRLGTIIEWLATTNLTDISQFNLTTMIHLQQLTEKSLYTPRKKKTTQVKQQHQVTEIPEQLIELMKKENTQKLKDAIHRDRVSNYVLERIGTQNEINIENFFPNTNKEFLYFAHIYLYGYDEKSNYQLIGTDNAYTTKQNLTFTDRKVVKK